MADPRTPLTQQLQQDAIDAAWRTAATQFVKLARDPIAAALSRKLAPGDESLRSRIAAFLETEVGTAVMSGLLSMGLSALPGGVAKVGGISQAHLDRLTRELRLKSMAEVADVAADLVMGPLRETLSLMVRTAGTSIAELPATTEPEPAANLDSGTTGSGIGFGEPATSVQRGR